MRFFWKRIYQDKVIFCPIRDKTPKTPDGCLWQPISNGACPVTPRKPRPLGRGVTGFTYCFIQPIRFYQQFVSLRLAPSCRYHPSCSSYFIQAIRHFGLLKGSGRGFLRILRCNPFSLGGYDPVIGDKNDEPRPFLLQGSALMSGKGGVIRKEGRGE